MDLIADIELLSSEIKGLLSGDMNIDWLARSWNPAAAQQRNVDR